MSAEINYAINSSIAELRACLEKYAPSNAVSFDLFINHNSTEYGFKLRDPEQLRKDGGAMKNIAGEWIKP